MPEARVHWRAPGTTWAWCSASIHGHRTTLRRREVTCLLCKAKGRPPRQPLVKRLHRRR